MTDDPYHVQLLHGKPCGDPQCGMQLGAVLLEAGQSTAAGHQQAIPAARARLHDPADHAAHLYAWGPDVPAWSEHKPDQGTPARADWTAP